jgi:hypothetical protein
MTPCIGFGVLSLQMTNCLALPCSCGFDSYRAGTAGEYNEYLQMLSRFLIPSRVALLPWKHDVKAG